MEDIEQKKTFSRNLSHYLNISGKTQREVAAGIKVSPQTFNTWIQCIALPRMGKIQALADYFKINKTDLLDKHDFTTPSSTLTSIYEQLEPIRQVKVVDYAKEQLKEQEDYSLVNAAHERTDIVGTKEMKDHDNDIMDDENF